MIALIKVHRGERAVDLGSGDGRIIIALAEAGAEAHGYEHNPFLVWWSRWKIRHAGLSKRAFIHRGNFWNEDFSKFTIITVFGIQYIMSRLEEKLDREVLSRTRVISYTFPLPNWTPISHERGIYLYERPPVS